LEIEAIVREALTRVFALRFPCHRVKGDCIAVVDENQIIEPEMSGERTRLGRNAFLETTISGQTNNMLIENLMLGAVESRGRHLRRHRHTGDIPNPFPPRPRG